MTNIEPTVEDHASARGLAREASSRGEARARAPRETESVVLAILADAVRSARRYVQQFDAGHGAE